MSAREEAANLGVYSTAEVVAHYADLDYLTACEQLLFETYLHPGMSIMDLGVGGGRTTPHLSAIASASSYVGVDYSEQLIRVCRSKFPHLQFKVADASDLSQFADCSFDAIVFSFNGIDELVPDNKRRNCLRECHRVLKTGGIYIFSTHNPRCLFIDLQWDRNRLRTLARRAVKREGVLFHLILATLTCGRIILSIARSLGKAIPRIYRRIPTAAFWRGEGYVLDAVHGGLQIHYAVPAKVVAELNRAGFRLLQQLPENYPVKGTEYSTRWYYYAFSKD
jgi:ubiquinone/menaquinone biosynthesis C-methylase UbiE